jgi:hypothetical protein
MAIHHPTPPFGGGERPRLPLAQVGPVTQAIRTMRTVDPIKVGRASSTFSKDAFVHDIRTLSRAEVENLVEGLIDLLDAWDGDADREPDTDHEPDVDREPDEQDSCADEWAGRGTHRFNVGRAA